MRDLTPFFSDYMPYREDYMDRVDLLEQIREEGKDE